jgi:hypothetical protein
MTLITDSQTGLHVSPIEWAEKGVRKEDYVQPWLCKMVRRNAYAVYFIFTSMEHLFQPYDSRSMTIRASPTWRR